VHPTHRSLGAADRREDVEVEEAQPLLVVEELKADFFVHARPGSLIRRFASPEEVADHAVYLCSPRAGATTGAAHRVEGGLVDTCF
jgi:NAD(P)-dependent dehydrogenase (short-subunit alcohol dehydrogenase family)